MPKQVLLSMRLSEPVCASSHELPPSVIDSKTKGDRVYSDARPLACLTIPLGYMMEATSTSSISDFGADYAQGKFHMTGYGTWDG